MTPRITPRGACARVYWFEDMSALSAADFPADMEEDFKFPMVKIRMERNQILKNPWDISPLKFEMIQDEVIEIFGKPDAVSTMRSDGKPLILKYHDIELHFDRKAPHGLYLVYSDDEIELSMTDQHEELLQPITNIEPVDNEFFLRDGVVYFSGLYEHGLLKGV